MAEITVDDQYARSAIAVSHGDLAALLERLSDYNTAVAAQAAMLVHQQGTEMSAPVTQQALRQAEPQVRDGFKAYIASWRESQQARERQ